MNLVNIIVWNRTWGKQTSNKLKEEQPLVKSCELPQCVDDVCGNAHLTFSCECSAATGSCLMSNVSPVKQWVPLCPPIKHSSAPSCCDSRFPVSSSDTDLLELQWRLKRNWGYPQALAKNSLPFSLNKFSNLLGGKKKRINFIFKTAAIIFLLTQII